MWVGQVETGGCKAAVVLGLHLPVVRWARAQGDLGLMSSYGWVELCPGAAGAQRFLQQPTCW